MSPETKNCQNCKQDFIIESDDFAFYEKIKVPPPTFCFDCRLQRKLAYINERIFFKRQCDKCKNMIISMHSPESPYTVWCTSCYNSDDKDVFEHGISYDFSRSFFEQFQELSKKVPRLHLVHKNNNAEGCEYANYTYKSRNVYLSFEVVGSEDIYYSKQVMKGNKSCIDSMNIIENERGYELIDSNENYNCRFLVHSNQCVDSSFLMNCRNCTDCCLSYNQQNKSYVFRNQQLSREAYMQAVANLNLDTYSGQEKAQEEFNLFSTQAISRFAMIKNSTDCTGNLIGNSNNVHYSFDVINSENAKYVVFGVNKMSDSYDLFYTGKMEMCYEVANAGAIDYKVLFSLDVGSSQNIFYSIASDNCHDIFGCIGLFSKSYSILNKQYTKEEYEALLPKIITHMNEMPYVDTKGNTYRLGEYFPTELSPYSYNQSLAYEEFPLTQSQAQSSGYTWALPEEKYHVPTIESNMLPDSINDVDDSIIKEVIACPNKGNIQTQCTFAYRIIPEEFRFYWLMKIPLPRYCPNCRYYRRRQWKLPWKLWQRQCMCDLPNHAHAGACDVEFETSYAPDRPEKVYCEKCYQQEVI